MARHRALAQSVMYRALSDYKVVKKVIDNFQLEKKAFFAEKEAFRAPFVALRRIKCRHDAQAVKLQ